MTTALENLTDNDIAKAVYYQNDWNAWIFDILGVTLDAEEKAIVESVQHNRRTSVRSGHARGKDYTAAAIALAFINNLHPSKVIHTAPTGRQVLGIMMAEISKMYNNSRIPLGGTLLTEMIKYKDTTKYLLGFKAEDKKKEAWSGFHSENILVIVSEASGVMQETHDAIEGILTGTISRLLLVFNPTTSSGEAYSSTKSSLYSKHKLNCLNAPNVLAKKIIYPGQVDYIWVKEKVEKWCIKINEPSKDPTMHEFKFENQWYKPNDLFMVKVLAEYPRQSSNKVIPLEWVELANARWLEFMEKDGKFDGELRVGADIAGMGVDSTVFVHRYLWKVDVTPKPDKADKEQEIKRIYKKYDIVEKIESYFHADHMDTAERLHKIIPNISTDNGANLIKRIFVDTIGEGAGVHSRLKKLQAKSISVKFGNSSEIKGLSDITGERSFVNVRAYCMWAVRDALDPNQGGELMLPPDDELTQELTEPIFEIKSNGDIQIEPKDDIKARIGRSPDRADSLAQTFYPFSKEIIRFI